MTLLNTTRTKNAFVSDKAQLKVQWYAAFTVLDRAGNIIAHATIEGTGKNGSRLIPWVSGPDGTVQDWIVTEFIQNSTGIAPEFTYYSPYGFLVTKDRETNRTENISISRSISSKLYFDFAPRITVLSDMTVKEDEPYLFNLTPYLFDPDNSLDIVGLTVDRDNITVDNATHTLVLLFPRALGVDTITITASDGLKSSNRTFLVAVTPVNDPPVCMIPIPDQTVYEDQTLELDLKSFFYDEESGTKLSFSCNKENISIDDIKKNAYWTPGEGNSTLSGVVITATDGFLSGDSNVFNITFVPVNEPPIYLGGLIDVEVKEHKNWTINLEDYFTDEEGPLGMKYDCSNPEVRVDPFTRRAIWAPSGNATYDIEVHFTAHDAENYSMTAESETIHLTYIPVDDPPRFVGKIPDASIRYGGYWNITLEDYFTDEDTAALRFSVNYPAVIKIIELDKTRHNASWKPRKGDSNLTNVIFTAYDGTTRTPSLPVNISFEAPAEPLQVSPIIWVMQSVPWYIYALIPIAAVGGVAAFYTYRRVKYGKYDIEQLFLVYNDGRLLSHRQRTDTAQVSNELMSGMLTALKGFVKESLMDHSRAELDEMKYGELKIAIVQGKNAYLAAFISGYATDKLKAEMTKVLERVEAVYEPVLRSWDGMLASVEGTGALLDELLGAKEPEKGHK